jgi:hypothetical protein
VLAMMNVGLFDLHVHRPRLLAHTRIGIST